MFQGTPLSQLCREPLASFRCPVEVVLYQNVRCWWFASNSVLWQFFRGYFATLSSQLRWLEWLVTMTTPFRSCLVNESCGLRFCETLYGFLLGSLISHIHFTCHSLRQVIGILPAPVLTHHHRLGPTSPTIQNHPKPLDFLDFGTVFAFNPQNPKPRRHEVKYLGGFRSCRQDHAHLLSFSWHVWSKSVTNSRDPTEFMLKRLDTRQIDQQN